MSFTSPEQFLKEELIQGPAQANSPSMDSVWCGLCKFRNHRELALHILGAEASFTLIHYLRTQAHQLKYETSYYLELHWHRHSSVNVCTTV